MPTAATAGNGRSRSRSPSAGTRPAPPPAQPATAPAGSAAPWPGSAQCKGSFTWPRSQGTFTHRSQLGVTGKARDIPGMILLDEQPRVLKSQVAAVMAREPRTLLKPLVVLAGGWGGGRAGSRTDEQ